MRANFALVLLIALFVLSPVNMGNSGYHHTSWNQTHYKETNGNYANNSTIFYTLDLWNGTLINGNFINTTYQLDPVFALYDQFNNYLYIADSGSDTISIINSSNGRLVGDISVGRYPISMALDTRNRFLYVVCEVSDEIAIINTSTNQVVGNISVGLFTNSIAYDPINDLLFVTSSFGDNVTAINPNNGQSLVSLSVGNDPQWITFVPYHDSLYVSNYGSNTVSVINITSVSGYLQFNVSNNIAVLPGPTAIAYDSMNNSLYVADSLSDYVSIINVTSNSLVENLQVGPSPDGIGYDPINNFIYVSDGASATVNLINATNNQIEGNISVGSHPTSLTFSYSTGNMYVANEYSYNISIINAHENSVVGSISLGYYPTSMAYDPLNGEIYVAMMGANFILTVNATNFTVYKKIYVGYGPNYVYYNNYTREIYVSNGISGNVTVLNATNNQVVSSIKVGSGAFGITYDPVNKYLYVANLWSDNISIINSLTDQTVGSINDYVAPNPLMIGMEPENLLYDPENGYIYVANFRANFLTLINSTTNQYFSLITVGIGPDNLLLDPYNGLVYVTNYESNNVTVLNGTSLNSIINVGNNPYGMAIYGKSNYLFVTNSGSNNITVINTTDEEISGTIKVGIDPQGLVYDVKNGYLFVANEMTGTISIIKINKITGKNYAVVFNERGLPYGSQWYVSINGTTKFTQQQSIIFYEPNGTYSYEAGTYAPQVTMITGSLIISGKSTVINITFTYSSTSSTNKYPVRFEEYGLPYNTTWSVTLNGITLSSQNSTITFLETNGTYSFQVGVPVGYKASPSSGTVDVNGQSVTINVYFTRPLYNVVFIEKNLPNNETWGVIFNGTEKTSNSSSISFLVPNGSYEFRIIGPSNYSASPSSGNITVSGSNFTQTIYFSLKYATIIFIVSGLPSNSSWSVNFAGTVKSSTSNIITFNVTPGTYNYSVMLPNGFTANNLQGSVIANSSKIIININAQRIVTVTSKQTGSAGVEIIEVSALVGMVLVIAVFIYITRIIRKGKK